MIEGVTRDRQSAPAIELVDVVKSFGSERVLDGVDLAVPAGAITVLLGPSGAGKTVTIKHIVGLIAPTAGSVVDRGQGPRRPLGDASCTSSGAG